ncbi:uncharacterized protein LOC133203872 [Saccostrea echinata]|uniref:uncharacterized protein LOC133203872 n=1 Tax=Saccostrea echinata TaxID=191078 RepID=UPI002A83D6ED|nr:uncharacterized protein LOC133203872 [Saccostrea echinata]
MLDLAGQFAYYACHQIYITERVFFILVLNVTQKFEDYVSTEENNQQGSIFSTWTYKDYVKFWISSIKTFGSTKAPVLIIATHTEEKSEDEMDEYFKEFWKAVPVEDRDWLRWSLVDSEYEIDLLNLTDAGRETLESIKTSIIKAATQKLSNTMKVPSKWALLEQLIKEKKEEVMSFEEIWDINTKCLPFEFQLENKTTLSEFLKFFHSNGLLLWFEDGNNFEDHSIQNVILNIQWFAIAVNKLIADKNHIHKDCKKRYYTEWDLFNKTGKLDAKLLTALWQDVPSYLNHKTEIMTKMEKQLHMLVSLHSKKDTTEKDKAWFVPCMNKRIFNQDFSDEKWEYSSILCFRFLSFAMFVYYRLVAYCMSYLKWNVTREKESFGLYQTASIFDYKNHTVVIGICENDIQVQLKRIKTSIIETNISIEIGETVQIACKNLTDTFDEKIYFHKGHKCQRIICNNEDRSFIPFSEIANIRKGIIQCKFCSVMHSINVEETLRFWEKDVQASTEGNREGCFRDYRHLEGKKIRRTEPEYPFSKGVCPTDVMTSFIKVEVSKSVGLILVDGISEGKGFRVWEKYIMTCLHVIEEIVKDQNSIESDRICVQFGKTKVTQTDDPRKKFRFESTLHFMDKDFDVAILELKVHQESGVTFAPPLTSFGKMQYPSEIHLIGHTGCVQMKEDSQVYPNIIKPNNNVDIYVKWLSGWSRENLPNGIDYYAALRDPPQKILFSTTFAPGSSGSPGFMIRQQKAYVVLIVRAGVPSCFYQDGVHVPSNKRV